MHVQVVVTLLDPLQEGGAVAAAAVTVLEQLVVHARHLLGDKLKTLPPLPQVVEGLGKPHCPFLSYTYILVFALCGSCCCCYTL